MSARLMFEFMACVNEFSTVLYKFCMILRPCLIVVSVCMM